MRSKPYLGLSLTSSGPSEQTARHLARRSCRIPGGAGYTVVSGGSSHGTRANSDSLRTDWWLLERSAYPQNSATRSKMKRQAAMPATPRKKRATTASSLPWAATMGVSNHLRWEFCPADSTRPRWRRPTYATPSPHPQTLLRGGRQDRNSPPTSPDRAQPSLPAACVCAITFGQQLPLHMSQGVEGNFFVPPTLGIPSRAASGRSQPSWSRRIRRFPMVYGVRRSVETWSGLAMTTTSLLGQGADSGSPRRGSCAGSRRGAWRRRDRRGMSHRSFRCAVA